MFPRKPSQSHFCWPQLYLEHQAAKKDSCGPPGMVCCIIPGDLGLPHQFTTSVERTQNQLPKTGHFFAGHKELSIQANMHRATGSLSSETVCLSVEAAKTKTEELLQVTPLVQTSATWSMYFGPQTPFRSKKSQMVPRCVYINKPQTTLCTIRM